MVPSRFSKCKGMNRKGERCKSDCMPSSEYCAAHQDQAPRHEDHDNMRKEGLAATKPGRAFRVLKLAWSLFGILSVLLNFWLGYDYILPRVTASIVMPK